MLTYHRQSVVLMVLLACFSFGADLPSTFKKCKRSLPKDDFNKCLAVAYENALQKLDKGIPDINFPSIQPVDIPSLTIGEGTGAVQLVQNFKNVKLYNIIHAKVEKADATITDKLMKLNTDVFMDELLLEADYDFNGKVLVLPIVGTGKATIKLEKVKANLALSGEAFEKKGKSYLEIKDAKLELKPERVVFKFDNLFNGNELLGAEMNKVLNDNWREVFQDVQAGYEEALGIIVKNIANILFKKVPRDDIFPV